MLCSDCSALHRVNPNQKKKQNSLIIFSVCVVSGTFFFFGLQYVYLFIYLFVAFLTYEMTSI